MTDKHIPRPQVALTRATHAESAAPVSKSPRAGAAQTVKPFVLAGAAMMAVAQRLKG